MKTIPLIDPPRQSMTLADGRTLEWQEFGLAEGRPVLYFHGGGSHCLEAGIFHREAVERNIRLIATNRPGAGNTTVCPGRPVAAYSNDLNELLDRLKVGKVACLGESNGGMVTLAMAAAMASRVIGAIPINPTVPWFDPLARGVTPGSVAIAYRMMKYCPALLIAAASLAVSAQRKDKAKAAPRREGFNRQDLWGPPPGTEPDVADFQRRVMAEAPTKQALPGELKWAASNWGVDLYSIPTRLDFYCGVFDAQAPFALVLADLNPDARFHYFSYGHLAFSHPDARRRIFDRVSGYFEP
jgi:pimeloyl-ACP methyl ester carboxylesterase